MNPFQISPLGGVNVGANVGAIVDAVEQRDLREEEEARRGRIAESLQSFMSGQQPDLAQLYKDDPQLAINVQQQFAQRGNEQTKQQTIDFGSRFLASEPEARRALLEEYANNPEFAGFDLDDQLSLLSDDAQERLVSFVLSGLTSPDEVAALVGQREEKFEPTALLKNLQAAGIEPSSEEGKKLILNSLSGPQESISVNPDGSIQITKGGQAPVNLPKKVSDELASTVASDLQSKGDIRIIRENYDPRMLTLGGKASLALGKSLSSLGIEPSERNKEFIQKRRVVTQAVNRAFNNYRKEITGAAAAVSELESLKKSLINEDLTPVEFESALNDFEDFVNRAMDIKQKMLKEGINPNEENFGIALDKRLFNRNSESKTVIDFGDLPSG